MKIKLNIQKDGENLIKDRLIKESEAKPKKVYFFMGNIKESGFDILEECLIDLKARKLIVIGIDKKNTTKKMLNSLYNYTKSIYVFNNNGLLEFDSNIAVFEQDKKAVIYIMNSNTSEGSFVDDIATYTEVLYDLEDKQDEESYKEYINNLVSISKLDSARKLDKEYIKELFDNGQIFTTKQYTHSVMSIAELLGEKDNKESTEKDKDVSIDDDIKFEPKETVKIPTVDLSDIEDFNIDIDIDDSIKREESIAENIEDEKLLNSVKKNKVKKEESKIEIDDTIKNEEADFNFDEDEVLDIEDLLFEKSDIELDKKVIKKKISDNKKEEKAISKKLDLTKVSNLIMELPKKPTKGKDVSVIKIPNYIKEMIPEFFSASAKYKTVERIDGIYKEAKINLEIVNIISGEKYSDPAAKILMKTGQTYITFFSEYLSNIKYNENDIVRIIKLSSDTYHIEIVSQDVQEYKIWKKLCTKNLKGSSRTYGVM